MGGDVIAGTNHVDALKVFEHDDDTEAIIIVGELGGTSEEEAADWIKAYKKRTNNPKYRFTYIYQVFKLTSSGLSQQSSVVSKQLQIASWGMQEPGRE